MFIVTRNYSTAEKHFCQPLFMVRALKCRDVCGRVVNTEYRTGFFKILTRPPTPICRMHYLVPFEDFYVRIIRVRPGGELGTSLSHLNGTKDSPHSYMVQGNLRSLRVGPCDMRAEKVLWRTSPSLATPLRHATKTCLSCMWVRKCRCRKMEQGKRFAVI